MLGVSFLQRRTPDPSHLLLSRAWPGLLQGLGGHRKGLPAGPDSGLGSRFTTTVFGQGKPFRSGQLEAGIP